MARSVNMVILVGNLTRDPELRYTPSGAAVVDFGLATNRSYTKDSGEKVEETEFHNCVAWTKLAEICSQYLKKGSKVYVKGRLQTRSWEAEDKTKRSKTEVVLDDMVMLDKKSDTGNGAEENHSTVSAEEAGEQIAADVEADEAKPAKKGKKAEKEENVDPEDIPF